LPAILDLVRVARWEQRERRDIFWQERGEKPIRPAVAVYRKYCDTKWASSENGSGVMKKLREAPQNTLPVFCLLLASALSKPSLEWKAQKNLNKHPFSTHASLTS
jgi:hypothetical protein